MKLLYTDNVTYANATTWVRGEGEGDGQAGEKEQEGESAVDLKMLQLHGLMYFKINRGPFNLLLGPNVPGAASKI